MAYSKRKSVEYISRSDQERLDEQCLRIHASRVANRERAETVALREEMQEHERKAAELREEINGYFLPKQSVIGAGGEVVPDVEAATERLQVEPDISDVDALKRTASLHRLEALANADAFAMGVELAESVEATNSVERCMAHQMGVAHALALRLAAKSTVSVYQVADWVPVEKQQAEAYSAARLANSAARLMDAFSRSAEALHKIRGGNPQQIVVQHIHMDGHAQAVINPNAEGRGK